MTEHPPAPQYLATGFRDVDRSGDTTACIRCLDLLSDIPFFRNVKEESYRIIARSGPARVLDAGCGAGTDLCTLASVLPPATMITGLDSSAVLLAAAAERTAAHRDRCLLVRGDLTQIPCRDNAFSACRIDRVLQHVHDPERVIRELVRVTAPGGTLVAFDNDWDTLSISSSSRETSARLTRFWSTSFASGRVGRDLAGIFRNAGLTGVHAEPKTLTISGLSLAEKVFDIRMLLNRMEQSGVLTGPESAAVWEDLVRRAQRGMFSSGYTGFLVWGTKPGA
nr:methyltransferase domain-containing protein [uncultured Methanoregula sp.]